MKNIDWEYDGWGWTALRDLKQSNDLYSARIGGGKCLRQFRRIRGERLFTGFVYMPTAYIAYRVVDGHTGDVERIGAYRKITEAKAALDAADAYGFIESTVLTPYDGTGQLAKYSEPLPGAPVLITEPVTTEEEKP